jgi:hypothetical protein
MESPSDAFSMEENSSFDDVTSWLPAIILANPVSRNINNSFFNLIIN